MPELELRQSPNKRPELLILLGRQTTLAILEPLILRQRRIEFRLEECEEQIEEVDSETVRDDVPALSEDYAQEEGDEEDDGADPAVGCVGCCCVQVFLVYLCFPISFCE